VQADIPLTTGSRDQVRAAHAEGLRVTGWPGNTIEQLQTLVDWAVEGITTDFPGIALPFLREANVLDEQH
jgi:glycerophosphoryl diester phosphodiesterase